MMFIMCKVNNFSIVPHVNEAKTLYDGGSRNRFQFMHCWNIVKNVPRWTTRLLTGGYIQNQNGPSNSELNCTVYLF
jgi:hypothetical protein